MLVTGYLGLVASLVSPGKTVAGVKADKNPAAALAVIGVTVFREPGFALPGAEVVLEPDPESKQKTPEQTAPKQMPKIKKQKAVSDPRGELAFRVPAVPMRYNLSVKVEGFEPAKKQITVQGDEHQDVFFTLKPVK